MPIWRNYRGLINKGQAFFIPAFLLCLIIGLFAASFVYAKTACEGENADPDKCAQEIEKAQEKYESVSKQLSAVRSQRNSVEAKITDLSTHLSVTQEEINELQAEIDKMKASLEEIKKILLEKNADLRKKIDVRNKAVRTYYQKGIFNELELFMSNLPVGQSLSLTGFQFSAFSYAFDKSLASEALRLIGLLNVEIKNYESDKKEAEQLKDELEKSQNNLVALKSQLSTEKTAAESTKKDLVEKESDVAEELQSLQEKIDKLTSLQQKILAEKYGDSVVSGYEPPSYELPDPPFTPAFAAMSYGAYTHRDGMSQYGAKGRAQDGQNYEEILKFYYKTDVEEKDNFPDTIRVAGQGEMGFSDYLYGIAEMPSDWPQDALKAQAIAARTYAYGFAKNGKEICTTQRCQVFLKSKSDHPPDRWKKAVDDTDRKILKDSSTSRYSSTTGGYINGVGWDSKGSWPGGAYEKRGESPWFYKAWYTKNYNNSDTCGRDTPWLSEDDMADILNAYLVWRKGSSDERSHITPVSDCWDGDPYSPTDMAGKADKYGDIYTTVSDVKASNFSNGRTGTITFTTNKGAESFDAQEFSIVFNFRAPGYVSIRSGIWNGSYFEDVLYDIEYRN